MYKIHNNGKLNVDLFFADLSLAKQEVEKRLAQRDKERREKNYALDYIAIKTEWKQVKNKYRLYTYNKIDIENNYLPFCYETIIKII